MEKYEVLTVCTVGLSEIIFNILKKESMRDLTTKISLHIIIGLLLKSIIELIFQYNGVQANLNDRP